LSLGGDHSGAGSLASPRTLTFAALLDLGLARLPLGRLAYLLVGVISQPEAHMPKLSHEATGAHLGAGVLVERRRVEGLPTRSITPALNWWPSAVTRPWAAAVSVDSAP
jgi:hypothetical protein